MKYSLLRRLDITQLLTLSSLYETGSTRKTAAQLHVSQPAVSYTLAKLREVLNDELFVRVGNRLSPTPLVDQIMQVLPRQLNELQHTLFANQLGQDDYVPEQLRLAIPNSMSAWLGASVIRELKQHFPSLYIELHNWDSNSLQRIIDDELDGGISFVTEDNKMLISHQLGELMPGVVLRKSHPLAQQPTLNIDDLNRFPWIGWHVAGYAPNIQREQALGLQRDIICRVSDTSSALQLLLQSDALMYFETPGYVPQHEQFCFFTLPELFSVSNRHMHWMYAKRHYRQPFYQRLTEILQALNQRLNHESPAQIRQLALNH